MAADGIISMRYDATEFSQEVTEVLDLKLPDSALQNPFAFFFQEEMKKNLKLRNKNYSRKN